MPPAEEAIAGDGRDGGLHLLLTVKWPLATYVLPRGGATKSRSPGGSGTIEGTFLALSLPPPSDHFAAMIRVKKRG